MLDQETLKQVRGVLEGINTPLTLLVTRDREYVHADTFSQFVEEVASCSKYINVEYEQGEAFSFRLIRDGKDTGIAFRGIPNGHEFTSLLLALLNADGKGRNLPDEALRRRIQNLKGEVKLSTYVSLTCTNCPDVVQALNVMALLHEGISHEMVDGSLFQEEVDRLGIQAVPSVYANGKPFHVGRGDLGELLGKLENLMGTSNQADGHDLLYDFDQIVLGGGPAGVASAVFSARKGLKVAVVAQRIGGQVNDTTAIENIISVPRTLGTQLAADLFQQLECNDIEVFVNRTFLHADLDGKVKTITVEGGEQFRAPQVILATGAKWRRLGLENEDRYVGHGIHFCPHCDGPFYKGKDVAVIGGGNSGVEAAIDLAGICHHVSVIEYSRQMKADAVLQEKLKSLPNVDIFYEKQTSELQGDGTRLTGIMVKDRQTGEEMALPVDGVFLQIGLQPNSDLVKGTVATNARGEIEIDGHNRTNIPGVYAAGDVSTIPFKQIMIAMGEGAKAALAAFEDRMYAQ
ncbi:MAG: alkyl hydroperoxide reductase subunit F [Prevotella sp.]|jgi:alkyl hydroperoxide reductase subunit F|nr:alkyl hydroperoxide reductase subunit F [Prevotella sp.]HCN52803.1 alkyl hydroperoxide reductase subunit F [Prevotella sp.]